MQQADLIGELGVW